MAVKSYRDLIVWQKSLALVVQIYTLTRAFPKEELFGLTSQMRRAAVSVPSNIAEGQARNTAGEFRQFLGIAKGSLAELDTQTGLACQLGYVNQETQESLLRDFEEISKMLNGLQKSLG
jgi:four helix bundle protein